MGFQSKLWLIGVIIFSYDLSAQQRTLDSVNLDYIYNKWVMSKEESSFESIVYRNEDFFQRNDLDEKARTRWRFAKHSDVFVNSPYSKVKIYKKQIGRPRRTCGPSGSGGRSTEKFYFGPPQRTKGRWKLYPHEEMAKIELFYYKAVIGKPFELSGTQVYEIVHLEKDLMVLRKE
ncbi:hypothetical protein FEE95_05575 [Maribacter algarum]|uniref:Uncharacterized protein n=1 Tax=Maribacter algarum (ex Zhang et al. 2020) TaxID=2578118 RepID=A0A5S3PV71_9FLAO|nr:hypothetical protein [Maribacter algarum]TMM58901.1 hypothetical protein FEE95_05575 [Maribacter algarum]